MSDFIADAARSSWEHFTSWWVYPALPLVSVPLLVLVAFGVGGAVGLVAFRAVGFLAAFAYIYELRWRKQRRPKKGHSRGRA